MEQSAEREEGAKAAEVSQLQRLERELLGASQELHRLHREAAGLREQLQVERSRREELLTVVSHELRTPVTVISGYSRLLLTGEPGPLTDEQQRFLEESVKACRKLDGLLAKMLESCRVGDGGHVLEVCTASLAPLLEEVANALMPLAAERGVRIVLEADPERCRARFDPTRVEQILTNLVANALRHAAEGGRVEIGTRQLKTEGRDFVEVSVADDGPGVPPAERTRIFEAFVQGAPPARNGGIGLGLALCKRWVEAHGGSIGVTERPGGGARFVFSLPGAEH